MDLARSSNASQDVAPFDFQLRTRIVFAPGCIAQLGELACEFGARRALVVSDPGVVAAGHTAHGIESLTRAGIEVELFDGVAQNPTTDCVEAGLAIARKQRPDLLVGLGGGSSIDCAKGINFLYCCGGRMQDYWGTGKATAPLLPMIGVPTTAGTGSEAQSYALISDAQTNVKMACGDKKAACRVALLDPTLTLTQPPRVTAVTGIDAIAHAVETAVTRARNSISRAFSREAWRLLCENFPRVLAEPTNLAARGGMQLGACFAGLAIENSMLGATHALANPLTAHYGVVHGAAIAALLPHVVRYNSVDCNDDYARLVASVAATNGAPPVKPTGAALADLLTAWVRAAGLPDRLADHGVPRDELSALAEEAARQWTAGFNPRKVTQEDLLRLYEAAY